MKVVLTKRERLLLHLISTYGPLSKLKLVKLVFLISRGMGTAPYHFVPYKYGPFSFQLYHDLNLLENKGFISQTETEVSSNKHTPLQPPHGDAVAEYIRVFGDWTDRQLLDYVYEHFKKYTIFSEISRAEGTPKVVSIGYEGRTIDEFLYTMIDCRVKAVFDVRKNPFSMKFGFSKNKLRDYLGKFGIEYVHLPELGIPAEDRKNLSTLEDYNRLFEKYENSLEEKEEWLEKIRGRAEREPVALMCFERDPYYCHRTVIARKIMERGVEVVEV